MTNVGFIKLHRKIMKWEWYSEVNVRAAFIHCLLKANFVPTKWKGIDLPAGGFITSYQHFAEECGLSVQQTRTALKKLQMTNEITYKSTRHCSVITVNNWEQYQRNDTQNDNQITSK